MTIAHTASFAPLLEAEQAKGGEDIAFFTDIAMELGGPILELGCGTGRLAIPIARAGVEIVGLDLSAAMLGRFGEKLLAESSETRRRVRLLCGDMRRLPLKKRFRGIFCSSNTLFLLGSEDAIGEALAGARRCLAPGAMLVVDAAAIDCETRAALAKYPKGDLPDLDLSEGSSGGQVRRTHSIGPRSDDRYDAKAAEAPTRFSITYKYFDASDSVCFERSEDVVLPTPRELRHLMKEHGYDIAEEFGWYDRRSFSEGDRKLIVLARKKE